MSRFRDKSSIVALTAVLLVGSAAKGQIGEPFGGGPGGTFSILITHGATTIINNPTVPFPADIKINDGDAEDFVVIGYLDSPANQRPVTLKVVSHGAAFEITRLMSFYIGVPSQNMGVININGAGPQSLFNPANPGRIDVQIGKLEFGGAAAVRAQVQPQNSFFVSYMRDQAGRFYELPQSNAFNSFGHGSADIQVPGGAYLNAFPDPYALRTTCGTCSGFWRWRNLINPGAGTSVHNGLASIPSSTGGFQAGYVVELGLAIEIIPTTPVSLVEFVDVVIGGAPPVEDCRYDYNLDGVVDGLDVPGFIDAFLGC